MTRPSHVTALSIAGSDSGGGAGIQADLRSFAAFGVHGATVITALTAQNTRGVNAIRTTSLPVLRAQLDAVLGDFQVRAIKTGMLATPAIVRAVTECLTQHSRIPVVVDPVLVATTGAALAISDLSPALIRHLLPRADLLTPNRPEAERLLGRHIRNVSDLAEAGRALLDLGPRAVLMKGGHVRGNRVVDLLVTRDTCLRFEHSRLPGRFHGTGCTLSAAIAAALARGRNLADAATEAIAYVRRAMERSYRPGRGRLDVLDHFGAAANLARASE